MKIGALLTASVFLILVLMPLTSAVACILDLSLVNQDPYPAIPGEEVRVVFQVDGIGDPDCGEVLIEFIEEFPFTLVTGQEAKISTQGGSATDFGTFLLAPYKIKVDPEAFDGDNTVEIKHTTESGLREDSFTISEFNINVQDLRTDFEVSIKDYVPSTRMLTFEILNVGENDVEALTVEIPKQDNLAVKGSNRNIVGSLDANEDTTFSFEAIPSEGKIDLIIIYTDEINERRQVQKSLTFDPDYFSDRARDQNGSSKGLWITIIIVIAIVVWWFWRRNKKKKAHKRE